jgi:hypothetical protein
VKPFVTGSQVQELRNEVHAMTEAQQQTNLLLAELIEQHRTASELQRESAASAAQLNDNLSAIALAVAMVSFVVGLLAIFATLPASPATYTGIVAAGLAILLFLGLATRHLLATWQLRRQIRSESNI